MALIISQSGTINQCNLTNRERQLLIHVKKGLRNQEIAKLEEISVETVKKHMKNIYKKLGARNKIEALSLAGYI